MDDGKRLRKYNSDLIVCGKGVIAFGFWSVVQTMALILLSLPQYHEVYDKDAPAWMINLGVFSFALLGGGLTFLFHFLLGNAAIKAGRRNRTKYVYAVVALLYFIATASDLPDYFIKNNEQEIAERIEETQELIENDGEYEGEDSAVSENIQKEPSQNAADDGGSADEDGFSVDWSRIYNESSDSSIVAFFADLMLSIILGEMVLLSVLRYRLIKINRPKT